MTDPSNDPTPSASDDPGEEGGDEYEMPDEEELRAAQTNCAQWAANFMRMLLASPAELEVVLYLVTTYLTRLHRADQQPLAPAVALVRDTAAAVKARCWPVAPRVPKERATLLQFAARIPMTLDAVFALGFVEAAIRFAGAHCEAQLQADPQGASAPAITAEMAHWRELVIGFAEEVATTRAASGLNAMDMTPPEERGPMAPPPADASPTTEEAPSAAAPPVP